MALESSQLIPLELRNRSIPRPTPQHIPHLDDINNHVNNYINTTRNQVLSFSFPKQIHYWSSKVAENVQICIDILLPDFNNFTNLVMIRWLTIGYAIYQLIQIWKEDKKKQKKHKFIKTHTRIDEWLPYIVKKELPPNLIPRGTYYQLRQHVIIWENRDLVTKIPKLRGEHTHQLSEMINWIREFNEKVELMATQRNTIPDNLDDKIKLYNVYLAHHSKPEPIDDKKDKCLMLDALVLHNEYLPGLNDSSSSDDDDDDDDDDESSQSTDDENKEEIKEEIKEEDVSDDESVEVIQTLSRKDAQILKYKQTIKELKKELSQTKKRLKQTQIKRCQAERERYVYKELQRDHENAMNALHEVINRKTSKLVQLEGHNMMLKNELIHCKQVLTRLRRLLVESKDSRSTSNYSLCSNCSSSSTEYSSEGYTGNNMDVDMDIPISDNSVNITEAADRFYKDLNRNYNGSWNRNSQDLDGNMNMRHERKRKKIQKRMINVEKI